MGKKVVEDFEEFDEGEFEFDQNEEGGDEYDEGDVQDEVAEGNEAQEDPKEKQRRQRKEQKEQTLKRKLLKPNSDVILEAKNIWEQLRVKRLTKNERKELMNQMMDLVRGKVLDIIFKHDASRIIQCCIKYGSPEQRDEIAKELKGSYTRLSTSKYGKFIVSRILQYCTLQRASVIAEFYGKVRKLIRHKEASVLLDEAYSQYANSAQRMALMEEFYGPEFAVFKNTGTGPKNLQDLIEKEPMKKPYILKYMKSAIDSVLEKAAFNVGKTPILHRAILDYLTITDPSACKDMIELLKDHLVHMLHTREGAQVTQYCILHSTPKDRKQIVKSFKGFVHSIAKEQYGHAVLITCFECIDDTVLVSKALIGELFSPPSLEFTVSDLLRDQFGSRVILYLLTGRNKRYQPIYLIQELEATDEVRKTTTKKEHDVRHQQLLEATSPLLLEAVAQNVPELIRDKNGSTVLLETIYHSIGDVEPVLKKILEEVSKATDTEMQQTEEPVHVVKKMRQEKKVEKLMAQGVDINESVLVNRMGTLTIKSLIMKPKDDSKDQPWKAKFRSDLWDLLQAKAEEYLKYCANSPKYTAGLSFIFVALMENGNKELVAAIKSAISKKLKKQLDSMVSEAIKSDEPEQSDKKDKKRKRDETSKTGIQIFLALL